MTKYLLETYGPEIKVAEKFRSLEAKRWIRLGFLFRDLIGSYKSDPDAVNLALIEARTELVNLVNSIVKADDKMLEELKRVIADGVDRIKTDRKKKNLGTHG